MFHLILIADCDRREMHLRQGRRRRLDGGADAVLQETVDEPQDEVEGQGHGQADHEQPQQATAKGKPGVGWLIQRLLF